jgi:flagellar L-ring protein precursor FlgH
MSKSRIIATVLLLATGTASADIGVDPAAYHALTSDRRAYAKGDVLTVLVIESTTAESSAGTGASGSTSITASAGNQDNQYSANLATAGDTSGSGQTTRRGVVQAKVAVKIYSVEGGLFEVAGYQMVKINDEEQTVSINGWIRPDDIAADNTVLSNRMVNAKIEIIGDGVVTRAQKQNVFFRVLKWFRLI